LNRKRTTENIDHNRSPQSQQLPRPEQLPRSEQLLRTEQRPAPTPLAVLKELFDLLEEYAPLWYTKEIHDRAQAALADYQKTA
jgi:hypothetical protein